MGNNKKTPAAKAGHRRTKKRRMVKARIQRSLWVLDHGPCKCGSWDRLEIDHIIPLLKPHDNTRIFLKSPEKQDVELSKCQVLCRPCHLKKCHDELFNPTHGRERMYSKHGCRCQPCRDAHATKKRLIRQRAHARGIPWSEIW